MARLCRAVPGPARCFAMVTGSRSSRLCKEDEVTDAELLNGTAAELAAAPAAGQAGETWVLAGRPLSSRLIVGTGGVRDEQLRLELIGHSVPKRRDCVLVKCLTRLGVIRIRRFLPEQYRR